MEVKLKETSPTIVDLQSSLMSDFIVPDTMVDLNFIMRESPATKVASQEIVVVFDLVYIVVLIRIMEVTEVLVLTPTMLVVD